MTIVMAIPTMIASFFGMNVPVPWESNPMGFAIVSFCALCFTIAATFVLEEKTFLADNLT